MTEKEVVSGSEEVSLCSQDENLTFKNGFSQSEAVEIPGFGYARIWLWAHQSKPFEDDDVVLGFSQEGLSFAPAGELNRKNMFYFGVLLEGVSDINRQIFCKMRVVPGVEFQEAMVYDLPGVKQDERYKARGEHFAMTVDWHPLGIRPSISVFLPADAKLLSTFKFSFSTRPIGVYHSHRNVYPIH